MKVRALSVAMVAMVALVATAPAALSAARVLDDQYVLANARSNDFHRYLFAYSVECPGIDCNTPWWLTPPYRRHFLRIAPSLILKAAVTLAGNRIELLHLCGVLLHVANSLLLFVALGGFGVAAGWATLVAALFAAHPAGAEMAGATSFACVPVAAAFVLTSLIFWRRYRRRDRTVDGALCVLSVFLAMTSYEAAVLLPVAILAGERILEPSGGRGPGLTYACVALLPIYLLLRLWLHTEDIARPLGVLLFPGIRLGVAESVGYLLKTLSLLSFSSGSPYWLHGLVGEMAATVMAAAAVIAVVVWSRRRPLALVGVLLFVAFLLPPVAVRALVGVFNNPTLRQVYLPLVGAALIVGAVPPQRATVLGWCVVLFFIASSWRVSAAMRQSDAGGISAQVRRALADTDSADAVAWISQSPRYHVNYDWPQRQEYLLIPPPLNEGELQLCVGDSPRQLIARAPTGFSGRSDARRAITPGPVPLVDFLRARWAEPEVFRTGEQLLPFARIDVADPAREPTSEMRFTLNRDLDHVAFLRYSNGAVTRVRPSRCP